MKAREQKTALVRKVNVPAAIEKAESGITDGLRLLAAALSQKVEAPQVASILKHVKTFEADIEALYKATRTLCLKMLEADGVKDEESSRRTLRAGDLVLSMRLSKSGYDPKKVELFLRGKGKSPGEYMTTILTYKTDEALLEKAVADKVMTADEKESLRYDESWTLEPPKPVGEDE